MRRGVKYGLCSLGGVAGLLVAGGVFLTLTGPGERSLLGLAGWALSSETQTIEIGELTGSLFGRGEISRIVVSDSDGAVAEIGPIRFNWSPSGLLGGRVLVQSLQVDRVDLQRLPAAGDPEADGAGDAAPRSMPANAADMIPLPIRIDRFEIGEAILGEPVLGSAARLSISGQINSVNPQEAVVASISVQDLDKPSFARADAEYHAETDTLRIAVNAEEKAGGVLTTLLDIEGAQKLTLGFNGEGQLESWRGGWMLAVDDERAAGGQIALTRLDDALAVEMDADGEIGRFVPGPLATLLEGRSDFNLRANHLGAEQFRLNVLKLDAPRIRVRATGVADLATHAISGKGRIELGEGRDGEPVSLAIDPQTDFLIRNAEILIDAIPGSKGTEFKANLEAQGIDMNGNSIEGVSASATALQPGQVGGLFETLETVALAAQVRQPRFADPALAPVAGDTITVDLSGRKDASKFTITTMTLRAAGGTVQLSGMVDGAGFEGETRLDIPDSAVLDAFVGRSLSGPLKLSATGRAGLSGDFNLDLEGAGQNLVAGGDVLGKLLAGGPLLSGRVAHDENGFRFDALALRSDNLDLAADGSLSARKSDLKITGAIPDIAAILPNSSGAVQIEADLEGKGDEQALAIRLNAPSGRLHGLSVSGVSLSYHGSGGFSRQAGAFEASGQLGDSALSGEGQIGLGQADGNSIRNFELSLGSNRLTAQGLLPASGKAEGRAQLQLNDTSLLSQALGVPMSGSATVEAELSGDAAAPQLRVTARAPEFAYNTIRIASLEADMMAADTFEQPVFSGQATIESISSGGNTFGPIRIESVAEQAISLLTFNAATENKANLSAKARIALPGWQPDISLSELVLTHPRAELRQSGSARLKQAGNRFTLDGLVLKSGKGRVSADAVLGDQLEGRITVSALPLGIAGIFAPGATPKGTLDGEIKLSGSADNPKADYRLSFKDVLIPDALPPGFPDLDLSAAGAFADGVLTTDVKASGAGGVSVSIAGTARDPGGATVLQMKASGAAPMRLANSFLALRGTQADGEARFDLTISGNAEAPVISGAITASGASLNDPPTGISLADVNLAAKLSGGKVQIQSLKARSPKGGTVEASGMLDISRSGKLPVALKLSAQDIDFNDGRIVAGQASSNISLEGDLLADSKLDGTVDIARLDVRIPQALPASVSALDLKHKNAPDHIKSLQPREEKQGRPQTPTSIALSLDVRSADRIFVVGRGLDAQLGGDLKLSGSADNPRAIGQFTLQRGRIDVLGRSLDITSGTLDFSGDLDPRVNFTAVTEADSTRITISVTGNASNPQFGFSSVPELPEDEILALLLFNKSLAELTPIQIVQLASQVSELGGLTGGPGVLDKLKSTIGIDRLDVTTTENGDVAVSAGSYVNENVYVGVEQGTPGDSSRVKVDLDITKNIKLRGEAGANGESKLGVGVEWEY